MTRMTLDPMPLDGVVALVDQRVKRLPQISIFHRLLGGGSPTTGFPAVDPFGNAFAHIFAI